MNSSEKISWYKTFDSFRKSRVKSWTPKVYKELINMIKSATDESSINIAMNRLTENVQIDKLAVLIQNIYVDAGRVMGGKAYQLVLSDSRKSQKAMMPIGYNEELINEIIQYFQINLLSKVVLPISQTMKEWILQQLIDGQEQGKSLIQIRDEIIKADFPKNRAIIITRTEVLRAANYGAKQGAKKAGYKTDKIWIAAKDFRTRRLPRDAFSHLAMDGITVDLDEAFHVPSRQGGYERLDQPGDPNGSAADTIQCRCTIGFSVKRDANGLPIKV